MHILLIAPGSPPKNAPEAMQVGRYLSCLDRSHEITLVTTPIESGWVDADPSLQLILENTRIFKIAMPWHRYSKRLLANRRLAFVHIPDSDFWLRWQAGSVIRRLRATPDVIYSRSYPFSAALLGRALKRRLQVPWVMHLSDPWVGSPYRPAKKASQDLRLEKGCIAAADAIAVTTEPQAQLLRERYPLRGHDIFVSPNVMPTPKTQCSMVKWLPDSQLRLVYSGALYGLRRPTFLLSALHALIAQRADLADKMQVHFFGNMTDDISAEFAACALSVLAVHGHVDSRQAMQEVCRSDIVLTIEPDGEHPLFKAFMPSKVLDYVALRRPILAITPEGSPSWNLCARGYGWAVRPGDMEGLIELLKALADRHRSGARLIDLPPPPDEFTARAATDLLVDRMLNLISSKSEVAPSPSLPF